MDLVCTGKKEKERGRGGGICSDSGEGWTKKRGKKKAKVHSGGEK